MSLRLIRGGLLERCPQHVEPKVQPRRSDAGSAFIVLLCGLVLGAAGAFLLVAALVAAH